MNELVIHLIQSHNNLSTNKRLDLMIKDSKKDLQSTKIKT